MEITKNTAGSDSNDSDPVSVQGSMKNKYIIHQIFLTIIISALLAKWCPGQDIPGSFPFSRIQVEYRDYGQSAHTLSSDTLEDKTVDFKKPVVYISTFMAVELAFMIVTGIADDDPSTRNFSRAFTRGPAPDNDHWFTNYVLHPLMGSESYLRAREGHWGWFGSFLFSSAASVLWEFIYESWTERPSTQDLLVTSTLGSLLGELRYQLKRKSNKKSHWFWPVAS